jgi:hypothetical protein
MTSVRHLLATSGRNTPAYLRVAKSYEAFFRRASVRSVSCLLGVLRANATSEPNGYADRTARAHYRSTNGRDRDKDRSGQPHRNHRCLRCTVYVGDGVIRDQWIPRLCRPIRSCSKSYHSKHEREMTPGPGTDIKCRRITRRQRMRHAKVLLAIQSHWAQPGLVAMIRNT